MIGKRYEQPRFQSDFYRYQYHKMLRLVNIISFCILLLAVAIIYVLFNPGAAHYYASTTTGQIITVSPAKQ